MMRRGQRVEVIDVIARDDYDLEKYRQAELAHVGTFLGKCGIIEQVDNDKWHPIRVRFGSAGTMRFSTKELREMSGVN